MSTVVTTTQPIEGVTASCHVVVPSLKVSGGNREALRLAAEISLMGMSADVVSMWLAPHPFNDGPSTPVQTLSTLPPRADRALLQLPLLMWRFRRWIAARHGLQWFVFTHYATFPLAWFVPRCRRLFFVQDLEWRFVTSGALASLLREFILFCYRHGRVITTNEYLSRSMRDAGVAVAGETPIWADPGFLTSAPGPRDIDFVMVLRKGAHKRLDLYLRFIELANAERLRVAVLSPEDELVDSVREHVALAVLRPTMNEMRMVYARSKCFIHLSEHEGFGLPPLEAMGAGCVPVCRDSGGVRAFMREAELSSMLLSLDLALERVFDTACVLLRNPARLQQLGKLSREVFVEGTARAEQRLQALRRILV